MIAMRGMDEFNATTKLTGLKLILHEFLISNNKQYYNAELVPHSIVVYHFALHNLEVSDCNQNSTDI